MPDYIATRNCVITGQPRPVRTGQRITLSERAARYPDLRGWIEPAPAEDAEKRPNARSRKART